MGQIKKSYQDSFNKKKKEKKAYGKKNEKGVS